MVRKARMARILRITITLAQFSENPASLQFAIDETVRTAKTREIAAVQIGEHVDPESIELTLQIVEDALRSAVGRTLGIQERLVF
jgi:low affinity Fe/Cu permease